MYDEFVGPNAVSSSLSSTSMSSSISLSYSSISLEITDAEAEELAVLLPRDKNIMALAIGDARSSVEDDMTWSESLEFELVSCSLSSSLSLSPCSDAGPAMLVSATDIVVSVVSGVVDMSDSMPVSADNFVVLFLLLLN